MIATLRRLLGVEPALPIPPGGVGYAVRVDRADGGHTLECADADPATVIRHGRGLRRYWYPIEPTNRYTIVQVTPDLVAEHRRPCRLRCAFRGLDGLTA